MPSPLLRVGALLAVLALAGCDFTDCSRVGPCRDGVALRLADARSYADGVVTRPVSLAPGAYTVQTDAGAFGDTCTVSAAPTVEDVVVAGTCGERLRVDAFSSAFVIDLDLPVLDAETVTASVTRDGEAVGATTAPLVYAQPSRQDTACRVETCQQARIEVPVD